MDSTPRIFFKVSMGGCVFPCQKFYSRLVTNLGEDFMKSMLLVALMMSLPTFATGFPQAKKVTCVVLSEVNGESQADQTFEMSVANLGSCQSKAQKFQVAGTDLMLAISYLADCQRPNGISYFEHIQGPALEGPMGSSVYARAFRLSGEYVKRSSLQLAVMVNGNHNNVVAHCEMSGD